MTNDSPEQLASTAITLLRDSPPPTETEIDDVLKRLAAAFDIPTSTVDESRRIIHSRLAIRMEKGETITSDDDHQPWLSNRRAAIDPFYWTRYRQLLSNSGWPPGVIGTLNNSTDELLDLLGDPSESGFWKRRGLVVGDVQSGKTASYAALICKAADAGYRMVILLTGILENVRRQTQERLDAAFVGLDSRDWLAPERVQRTTRVGVGRLDGRRFGIVFTSRERDFRKNAAQALNISLASVSEPVLVVTKKNKAVLQRLADWLRSRNADADGRIDMPLLLIDDEADNASINTRQDVADTTAINKAIRDLLAVFTRSSYVGFTATPFANIFIDPTSSDDMLGDDLFPRDFIHVLEPPTNYIGITRIFPVVEPGEADEATPSGILRSIDDEDIWLPAAHRKDAVVGDLPQSLVTAIRCFLLATAIRDVRAAQGAEGRGGGIHRSMLVNVSRFTDVQNSVAGIIAAQIDELRRAVRLHGALAPALAAAQSPEIAALESVFVAEFDDCGLAWPEVLGALHEAISPIVVRAVNQSTGAASLDYGQVTEPPGLRVIAVGGNSLSRGLTLEGLSTSYFLRNAKAYDTLLQMGRWFGYRDGYGDLCRLWVTPDAEGWYRHVAEATTELKRDFLRMKRRSATPREFGLRVRTHPDTLLITARNKMASGIDVVGTREISLMGRGVETATLPAGRRRHVENLNIVNSLLGRLGDLGHSAEISPFASALRWQLIPASIVADFLENFRVHPSNHDFQSDSISEWLREEIKNRNFVLENWTIAIPNPSKGHKVELRAAWELELRAGERKIRVKTDPPALQVSAKSAAVGGRKDVRHGLSVEAVRSIDDRMADAAADDYRQALQGPLLLIYLLRGREGPAGTPLYKDGLILPALGLHFPGSPETAETDERPIRYRLNRIAQQQLFEFDDEPTDDDDDD